MLRKAPTLLDFLLLKDEIKVYKHNNLNAIERIYFKNCYKLDEIIFWMKRDLKNFLKKILN